MLKEKLSKQLEKTQLVLKQLEETQLTKEQKEAIRRILKKYKKVKNE